MNKGAYSTPLRAELIVCQLFPSIERRTPAWEISASVVPGGHRDAV